MNAKEIGKRIKDLRKAAKLTQEQLAERLNVSKAYLAHVEIGDKIPSIDLFVDMVSFFNTSLDFLILGK